MKSWQKAVLMAALGMACSTAAYAESPKQNDAAPVQLDLNVPAKEQLSGVERALHSERYSEITMDEKSQVSAAINRIRVRLGDNDTVEQLNPQARTEVLNDEAVVNTILGRAHADSRMVCRRERATGTNRPERLCLTVAQRREATERARKDMRTLTRPSPKDVNL
ncbi:hypothetical protein ABRP17_012970 [Stenotrophomonas sp. WHRI 8082]|uniref:hypothetical protein n=1 Tax=Stenotrophomonas sp. WHRI 8082 TaxID=3162571 RepID=UPI0032EEE7AC